MWIAIDGGKMACTDHETEFRAPRSCPKCDGPARLNLLGSNNQPEDPFPELTEELAPAIASLEEISQFMRGRESQAFEAAQYTAGAAYARIALSAHAKAIDLKILRADWRRVRALEERRRWSQRDPATRPGVGARSVEVQ